MPLKLLPVDWSWPLGIVSLLCLTPVAPGQAQIIPDNTLPQNSQVAPGCTTCLISGGTVRGSNLFHSFREFSVPNGGTAQFNNAPNIQTILTRVTGDRASTINGILQTNNTANLFLLNPNGIVFGANAQLRVGGSFLATTANSFRFADGSEFSATNPTPALLTISTPIGLQFGANPAPIELQAERLVLAPTPGVPLQKTLALVGGDINLAGGSIQVINGQVELGAVGGLSVVGLSPSPTGFTLNYGDSQTFKNIQLTGSAFVLAGGSGRGVTIAARHLRLQDGSQVISLASGPGRGGDITVKATETIEFSGTANSPITPGTIARSGLLTATAANYGAAGNITVSARQITLLGGGQISSVTSGSSPAGNLSINATESIRAIGTSSQDSRISSGILTQALPLSTGSAGSLTINTNALTVQDGAQISSITFGQGSAGTLRVQANRIDLSGVVLTPEGKMFFDQRNVPIVSGLFASADQGSTGNAATLIVDTQQLTMRDGAVIQTSTLGAGDAGNILINADSIALTGTAPDGISPTAILAASGGIPRLRVGIPTATGKGGTLNITTNTLTVQDGAEIAVSSLNPSGNSRGAGNLQIQARTITLNDRGRLNAETASGNGGNLNLQVQETLLLRRNSSISATAGTAQSGGNGGNVTITAPFIIGVLSENSDITANAFTGRGGNINITTNGIFGLRFQPELTPNSDITASSEFGLSGSVILNLLAIDPSQGLVSLPINLVDPSNQISQACQPGRGQTASSFVTTGRGGIPKNPEQPLRSPSVVTPWVTIGSPNSDDRQATSTASPVLPNADSSPILEAQGWQMAGDGTIHLVANPPTSSPHGSGFAPVVCP